MTRFLLSVISLWIALASVASAKDFYCKIVSPDHEQTYAYGFETNRVWKNWNGHLALLLSFSNDPFVDRQNPRQWDNFRFDFPNVLVGSGGSTFYYQTSGGRRLAVATVKPGFLGFDEVRLLPNVSATVSRPHGYITVYLNVLAP